MKLRIELKANSNILKNSIFIFLFLISCKTYQESDVINAWYNPAEVRFIVYKTKTYLKSNDSLINESIDTLVIDPFWHENF